MINAIGIALSGLLGAAKKTEAVAANVANLNSAGALDPADGPAPYGTRIATQAAREGGGVKTEIIAKDPAFVPAYSPDSPFADDNGLIGVPNTNLAEEAVNLYLAKTAYKANIAVIKTAGEMQDELLGVFDRKV